MESKSEDYVLVGRVLDGSLNDPIQHGAVVVKADKIAWVGEAAALPEEFRSGTCKHIDHTGATIMPGMIDCHTHISFGEARSEEENALYTPVEFRTIRALYNAQKVLQAGVTSAFDAATTFAVAQAIRDAINSGMFPGPRFTVSGRQITNHQGLEDSFPSWMEFPPGQSAVLVKSKNDLVEAIRQQVKDQVDAIKVSGSNDNLITPDAQDVSAFTFEELKIIADETHRLDRICSTHARSRQSALDAARAGFDNVFHASYIDERGIEACLKSGSVITPTLTLLNNLLEAKSSHAGASSAAAFARELEAASVNLRRAYDAGVPLLAGSESGWSPVPYGQWHARELELFVTLLGLTPLQAIHTITGAATRLMSPHYRHKVGLIQEGRYADLLVVPGNPLEDITILQRPSMFKDIIKSGISINRVPPPRRERMWYEKTQIFLAGLYEYDEEKKSGVFKI